MLMISVNYCYILTFLSLYSDLVLLVLWMFLLSLYLLCAFRSICHWSFIVRETFSSRSRVIIFLFIVLERMTHFSKKVLTPPWFSHLILLNAIGAHTQIWRLSLFWWQRTDDVSKSLRQNKLQYILVSGRGGHFLSKLCLIGIQWGLLVFPQLISRKFSQIFFDIREYCLSTVCTLQAINGDIRQLHCVSKASDIHLSEIPQIAFTFFPFFSLFIQLFCSPHFVFVSVSLSFAPFINKAVCNKKK